MDRQQDEAVGFVEIFVLLLGGERSVSRMIRSKAKGDEKEGES